MYPHAIGCGGADQFGAVVDAKAVRWFRRSPRNANGARKCGWWVVCKCGEWCTKWCNKILIISHVLYNSKSNLANRNVMNEKRQLNISISPHLMLKPSIVDVPHADVLI